MNLGITGIGIISPLGTGKETNWKKLINSESDVKYNKILDVQFSMCQWFLHARRRTSI
jgi:3-oxoacyl-(acyl-carrier-protein) synthase